MPRATPRAPQVEGWCDRTAPAKCSADGVEHTVIPVLESADAVAYSAVAVVFFGAAAGMLGYSVVAFPGNLQALGFPIAIITLINDLLLVLIILEVLRTVVSYLAERAGRSDHSCRGVKREVIPRDDPCPGTA